MEAEATLGPDGRRCRKCNPVVMHLVDDDDGNGDKFEEVQDGAPQSTAEAVAADGYVPTPP